jgi:hypothetical protein
MRYFLKGQRDEKTNFKFIGKMKEDGETFEWERGEK